MTNNNNMMVVAQKVCFLYCRISIIFCKGPKKNPCPAVYPYPVGITAPAVLGGPTTAGAVIHSNLTYKIHTL